MGKEKMKVWDWVTSTTDCVRQKLPDLSSVGDVCHKGYSATSAATARVCQKSFSVTRDTTVHVGGSVATKARELYGQLSDDQIRGDAARVAKNLSVNSCLFLARSYGAGPFIDIVSQSWGDGKDDSHKETLKKLECKVARLEKELSFKKIPEQSEKMAMASTYSPELKSSVHQKPEDLLRTFMTHHFIGTRLLDDLIVPGARNRVEEKPASE